MVDVVASEPIAAAGQTYIKRLTGVSWTAFAASPLPLPPRTLPIKLVGGTFEGIDGSDVRQMASISNPIREL